MNEQKNKTVVVKIKGKWHLIKVEAGRIFTGLDHEIKAEKYLQKKKLDGELIWEKLI
tara:strand:+ start:380 stop:550 length:171 start_codon:yes stop_codon:yes gene_type:complete